MPSSSSRFAPAGVDPFLSEHDATWRDALHRLEAYSPKCLELDFNHLGIWQSAPVKGSANAWETFCGSVCAGNPQKVSELRRPQPLPPTARRSSGRTTERAPPEGRA